MMFRTKKLHGLVSAAIAFGLLAGTAGVSSADEDGMKAHKSERKWLAGDHHVHSEYSVSYDTSTNPPTPIIAGDAKYPIAQNATKARGYGLDWMVSTDHGGPNHSQLNRDQAYPDLLASRQAVPEVLQFYGMEFDTPAADHSSLIIPKTNEEVESLFQIESAFSKRDAYPTDSGRDTEPKMLEALQFMQSLEHQPVLFANHASRSATGLGVWGQDTPQEFRNWNDTAPEVATGMEGAPGHQAGAINPDGSPDPTGARGSFSNFPTMGGFDQMTAQVGGLWDSMLGEGRRWWITSTSDSHVNWRDGGSDFWPGEYSKTHVLARKNYGDILDGLRHGRVFVTTGDLVSELDVTAWAGKPNHGHDEGRTATMGETLKLYGGKKKVTVTIRLRDPITANNHGDYPEVRRVDLIVGNVTGPVADRSQATNPSTTVVKRFGPEDWERDGEYLTMRYTLEDVTADSYVRVRGTNTDEIEPSADPRGENPWSDLWFYSNPIFIEAR